MSIKLSQLHNFAAAVEAGAVRQAAKALNLSQSSVTTSIQQLESELGVVLLHRDAPGVIARSLNRCSSPRDRLRRRQG